MLDTVLDWRPITLHWIQKSSAWFPVRTQLLAHLHLTRHQKRCTLRTQFECSFHSNFGILTLEKSDRNKPVICIGSKRTEQLGSMNCIDNQRYTNMKAHMFPKPIFSALHRWMHPSKTDQGFFVGIWCREFSMKQVRLNRKIRFRLKSDVGSSRKRRKIRFRLKSDVGSSRKCIFLFNLTCFIENSLHQNGVPSTTLPSKKALEKSLLPIASERHAKAGSCKTIETIRKNRRLELFLTINGQEKNILPMSQVTIPPETKKRYDLADKDLESLAPGHWYAYKNGLIDKGNAKPWDDGLGADVPVQKRARKPET
eukprot:g72577.t1